MALSCPDLSCPPPSEVDLQQQRDEFGQKIRRATRQSRLWQALTFALAAALLGGLASIGWRPDSEALWTAGGMVAMTVALLRFAPGTYGLLVACVVMPLSFGGQPGLRALGNLVGGHGDALLLLAIVTAAVGGATFALYGRNLKYQQDTLEPLAANLAAALRVELAEAPNPRVGAYLQELSGLGRAPTLAEAGSLRRAQNIL